MRVRFLTKVILPGGPLYATGEVADSDRHFLTEERIEEYRRRGYVEVVQVEEDRVMDASTKAPAAPPAHKAILGRDQVAAKQKS